jgi:S1-C subfamily serine protease
MTEADDTPDAPRDEPPLAPPDAPLGPRLSGDADPTQPAPQSWPAQPPSAWPPSAPPTWPPSTPASGPAGAGWGSGGGAGGAAWPPPPRPSAAKRVAVFIATIALILASAGAGALVAVAIQPDTRTPQTTRALPRSPFTPSTGNGTGSGGTGSGGTNSRVSCDADQVARGVIPAIVNINTTTSRGRAAGTGMVITANGEVLTNNHVIADSTSITVDIGGTGNLHSARVVGYNVTDDVALLQIDGVSNAKTVTLGNPATVNIGDDIVAIGNALGQGGTPKIAEGSVTALDQQVTAGDPTGGITETLHNMIQIDAPIQPGDSGGALVNCDGEVVGMNTAASAGRSFRQQTGSNVGFAIPIDDAVDVVRQIRTGKDTDEVHIGGNRALLGVRVSDATGGLAPVGSGALVVGVEDASAASDAGIAEGDVVVSLDGRRIADQQALHLALTRYQPGDRVAVEWVDARGSSHTATVALGAGPPA